MKRYPTGHTFAPSHAAELEACSYRYFLARVAPNRPGRAEPLVSNELDAGNLVHAALRVAGEDYLQDNNAPVWTGEMLAAQLCRVEGSELPLNSAALVKAREILLASPPINFTFTTAVEEPWTYEAAEGVIPGGVADRIDVNGPCVHVVDYKSGHSVLSREEAYYDWQTTQTLAAFRRAYPDAEQIRFTFLYVGVHATVSIDWSPELDAVAVAQAVAFHKKLAFHQEKDQWPATGVQTPGECARCRFHNKCFAYKASLEAGEILGALDGDEAIVRYNRASALEKIAKNDKDEARELLRAVLNEQGFLVAGGFQAKLEKNGGESRFEETARGEIAKALAEGVGDDVDVIDYRITKIDGAAVRQLLREVRPELRDEIVAKVEQFLLPNGRHVAVRPISTPPL